MITSTSTANYRTLFDVAYAKLKEYDLLKNYPDLTAITSLEEYFHFLPQLTATLAENSDDVGQFMRIPLNEPHFIIDANTRTIIVPEDFNKHGVGVIGDQVAETLYFEVDRFFDTTDLNETVIYIQWINPAGIEGLSYGIWKTATDEKVIFGWALDEDIMMPTAKGEGGKIEFAVRFFNRGVDENNKETNELVYSLSTLSQTINIKKSLNFDVADLEEPKDLTGMLIKRLKRSTVTEAVDPAEAPVIKVEPDEDETDLDVDGRYLFKSQAYSTDSGIISYVLYKDGQAQRDKKLYNDGFALTDDENKTDAKDTYYEKVVVDGVSSFKPYQGNTIPDNNETIYEKFGMYELTTAGVYSVEVTNSKGVSTSVKTTKTVTIPRPSIPTITNFVSSYQIDAEGKAPQLKVDASGDGVLTYQWQKQDASGNYVNIEGATDATYDGAEGENWYNVIVTNTRNNDSISNDVNPEIWVTNHVEKPIIKEDAITYDLNVGEKVEVTWTKGAKIGAVKVILCQVNPGVGVTGTVPADIAADATKYTVIESMTITEGNSASFLVQDTGRYFVKMTNTRNTFTSDPPAYSNDFWTVV